jgi:hypothetical protein
MYSLPLLEVSVANVWARPFRLWTLSLCRDCPLLHLATGGQWQPLGHGSITLVSASGVTSLLLFCHA